MHIDQLIHVRPFSSVQVIHINDIVFTNYFIQVKQ